MNIDHDMPPDVSPGFFPVWDANKWVIRPAAQVRRDALAELEAAEEAAKEPAAKEREASEAERVTRAAADRARIILRDANARVTRARAELVRVTTTNLRSST